MNSVKPSNVNSPVYLYIKLFISKYIKCGYYYTTILSLTSSFSYLFYIFDNFIYISIAAKYILSVLKSSANLSYIGIIFFEISSCYIKNNTNHGFSIFFSNVYNYSYLITSN